jgi:hypothetical protein
MVCHSVDMPRPARRLTHGLELFSTGLDRPRPALVILSRYAEAGPRVCYLLVTN